MQTRDAVQSMLEVFVGQGRPSVKKELLTRLKHIRQKFQESPYFQTHEVRNAFVFVDILEDTKKKNKEKQKKYVGHNSNILSFVLSDVCERLSVPFIGGRQ